MEGGNPFSRFSFGRSPKGFRAARRAAPVDEDATPSREPGMQTMASSGMTVPLNKRLNF